jgi:hypothetical protein
LENALRQRVNAKGKTGKGDARTRIPHDVDAEDRENEKDSQ